MKKYLYAGFVLWPLLAQHGSAYPIDGYADTEIGRLVVQQQVQEGSSEGNKQPPGATLSMDEVDLRLQDMPEFAIPKADPVLTRDIIALLGENIDRYSLAVLDITDKNNPRYAEHRATELYNPGSVGKLVVAMAWFQLMAETFPDDVGSRLKFLRNTTITADEVILTDHHTVRRWDRERQQLIRRPLQIGDSGRLTEFMDWMLSASANAAASVLIKEAMLYRRFMPKYPVPEETAKRFFKETPRAELDQLLAEVLQKPVTQNGFDLGQLRQGSLFTATGKKYVGGTTSHASPRELMKFLVRLEQGRVVDAWSSREIKRYLYVTERRIRYASSPALSEAAVYFKSGSLYQCAPEAGFDCKKYHGNVKNLMHSVAIIEAPAKDRKVDYLVVLMSNVLRHNSAVDHQEMATRIHGLIEKYHQAPGGL